ncbi:hypothetical protein ACVNRM_20785 [Bacillus paranthracis]|uniref:hypothetical protein n=1 Tax=Bacillus TaxID=1386 RepID=UPI000771A9D0|nr:MULTISPECIES: hypothetical protein [Bacillus]KXI53129.1 hypothetical protein ACS45_08795 [Bacillus cereus]KAB7634873.1 hypothetical protein GBN96_18945 [Bacillus sp. B4-WWTP-NA-D-NA-NA]MCZ7523361.1 hypothetical protein [Bacillus pacificus]MDA1574737.1 hypothetical protein [Bacillus cereus group sp. TH242-3LC]RRB00245.1 hypothetical protein EH195_18955 [Bacillus pacificus]
MKNNKNILIVGFLFIVVIFLLVAGWKRMGGEFVNPYFLFGASLLGFYFAIKDWLGEVTGKSKVAVSAFFVVFFVFLITLAYKVVFNQKAITELEKNLGGFSDMFAYFALCIPMYIVMSKLMKEWSEK